MIFDQFRQIKRILKNTLLCKKKNNYVHICNKKNKVNISITGCNNYIYLNQFNFYSSGLLNINIAGDNCKILLEKNCTINGILNIILGNTHKNFKKIKNTLVHIGKGTTFESCTITSYDSETNIEIGEQCMFSSNIVIFHTDAHPIYDINTNTQINHLKNFKIGNHCWIGANCTLLKNVQLGNNNIIGWGSVITQKNCLEYDNYINRNAPINNCILAGNPAKIIKRNITWEQHA